MYLLPLAAPVSGYLNNWLVKKIRCAEKIKMRNFGVWGASEFACTMGATDRL
jgi:hypothetical protein